MSLHQGLEVHGYQPQAQDRVDAVNANKIAEERLLRSIEDMQKRGFLDPRWAAIARTHLEQGFMGLNRAIFQPSRVSLPEDRDGE